MAAFVARSGMRLILASLSPRRRDLLGLLHIPFTVVEPIFAETMRPGRAAPELARDLAVGKAESITAQHPQSVIVACDTLIALDSDVLGKPIDDVDAERMLRRLSGRDHQIHTAVAVINTGTGWTDAAVDSVRVWVKPLTVAAIMQYVATGESLGKAGGYAIQGQGAQLIARIHGDYTAAVGLPLRLVATMLRAAGIEIPIELDRLYETKPYPNWAQFAASVC